MASHCLKVYEERITQIAWESGMLSHSSPGIYRYPHFMV
jgi:hypothetical protein